jgi:hypothetical protein
MLSSPKKHRGAPKGNFNAVKHGFYTRRLHKRDLTGVESTDTSGLIEEIALIRVFTRRLLESIGPESDAYDLAEFLRALCLASSTITRVVKTQFLIAQAGPGMDNEIAEAIKQINAEFHARLPPTTLGGGLPPTAFGGGLPPTAFGGGLPPTALEEGLLPDQDLDPSPVPPSSDDDP